jgi:hypothetical protein
MLPCSEPERIEPKRGYYDLGYYWHPQRYQPSLRHQYSLIETFNGSPRYYYNWILIIILIWILYKI